MLRSAPRMLEPVAFFPRAGWRQSAWLWGSLLALLGIAGASAVGVDGGLVFFGTTTLFLLSVFVSFQLLPDRRLLNPIQVFVALFLWWFGVGPISAVAVRLLSGDTGGATEAMEIAAQAQWLPAIGLPLYALGARVVTNAMPSENWVSRHLAPLRDNYRLSTILFCLVVGTAVAWAIPLLAAQDQSDLAQLSYLGGYRFDAWWSGLVFALSGLIGLAQSASMVSLVRKPAEHVARYRLLAVVVILMALATAVLSGWKGAFLVVFLYFICAYVSTSQRPPLGSLIAVALVFVLFIEPFVFRGRQIAMYEGALTTEERQAIFRHLADSPDDFLPSDTTDLRVEGLFRGIYPIAAGIMRQTGWEHGMWDINTLAWGLEAQIPRALHPDKPEISIGNYITRTVGADIGLANLEDQETSISPTLPFEIVGNYGWVAGILSFSLIGAVWAAICVALLGKQRLESHPLMPFLAIFSLGWEAALGHLLGAMRTAMIPLAILLLLSFIVRRRI